ncbi:MAG: hypothetical protein ACOC5T_05610, partial [Elusimicrobiota bacterium]
TMKLIARTNSVELSKDWSASWYRSRYWDWSWSMFRFGFRSRNWSRSLLWSWFTPGSWLRYG